MGLQLHSKEGIANMRTYRENEGVSVLAGLSIAGFVVIVLCGLIVLGMWGCPKYTVYKAEYSGRAIMAEAEYGRKALVVEAEAKRDSEIKRAEGVAQANQIIAQSLKGNDDYLRYLWIQTLSEDDKTVVYIPTESNLPILEAGRIALQTGTPIVATPAVGVE
jgi:hypothetical protein